MASQLEKFKNKSDSVRSTATPLVSIQHLFTVALAGGIAAIVLSWVLDSTIIGFVTPLLLILIYLVLGLNYRSLGTTWEKFADSVYYLGFLFTLVALSTSLMAFEANAQDLSGLVSRFGMALSSTILGLAARIYIISFKGTLSDSKIRQEEVLADSIERFGQALDLSVQKASQFSDRITHVLESAFNKSLLELERNHQQIASAFEDATKTSEKIRSFNERSIQKLQESMNFSLKNVEKNTVECVNTLTRTMAATIEEIQNITTDWRSTFKDLPLPKDIFVATLQAPLEELAAFVKANQEQFVVVAKQQSMALSHFSASEKQIENVTGQLSALTQQIASLLTDLSRLEPLRLNSEALNQSMEDLAGELPRIGRAFAEQYQAITSNQASITSSAEEMAAINQVFKSQKALINTVVEASAKELQLLQGHRSALDKEFTKGRENLAVMYSQTEASFSQLQQAGKGGEVFAASVAQATENLKQVNKEMVKHLGVIRATHQSIAETAMRIEAIGKD